MADDDNIPEFNKMIRLASIERMYSDEIEKTGIQNRVKLGIYYTSKLITEPKGTLFLTGFSKSGRIIREKILCRRILRVPSSSRETIEEFVKERPCKFYAAARKGDDFEEECEGEYLEEAEFLYTILNNYNARLCEYVKVSGYTFTMLSPEKDKMKFPP